MILDVDGDATNGDRAALDLMQSARETLLQAFEAAGAQAGLTYVSVPITSGKREFALLRKLSCTRSELRGQFRDQWLEEVVGPNEEDACIYAAQARGTFSGAHLLRWLTWLRLGAGPAIARRSLELEDVRPVVDRNRLPSRGSPAPTRAVVPHGRRSRRTHGPGGRKRRGGHRERSPSQCTIVALAVLLMVGTGAAVWTNSDRWRLGLACASVVVFEVRRILSASIAWRRRRHRALENSSALGGI